MYSLFNTPHDTPLMYGLLIVYFITASITVFDTRLIQAKRNGIVEPESPMLPNWVGLIAWLDWIVLLSLFLLNWRVAIAAWIVKFILSVLPVLEIIGSLLMTPFKPKN